MKGLPPITLWIVVVLIVIAFFASHQSQDKTKTISIVEWLSYMEAGQIISAADEGGQIKGKYQESKDSNKQISYLTRYAPESATVILEASKKAALAAHPSNYIYQPKSQIFGQLFFSILFPILILAVFWMLLMRQVQNGGNRAMSFGKSRAKLVKDGEVKITFKDVAGVAEAIEELGEVVDYLKDPQKFSRLGGRIPRGLLLIGPPGTGKTLLARAIAGEAGVHFFSISGSDFVEMFVGVGASRVRDLFEQAKKAKPCIIFIDEIDAVGRSRFAGIGGGHDEREQTLNQLLVEMDGFNENDSIILIAATNRPDVLDPALLRPGRFDRQVTVDLPDVKGREQILHVHAKKIRMDQNTDLVKIAKTTSGFSGADLANLINEAALLAARRNKENVTESEFEEAKDRVMMGPERRSLVITDKEKLNTAYHEAGHAIIAHFLPDADPVHKVTIVPRGRALGVTWVLPGEDRLTWTKTQLLHKLYYAMGGRAAEQVRFGDYTTGAANDIERATAMAHRMICQYGMSEQLGPRAFGESSSGNIFLGKDLTRERNYSEETATLIDSEVKRLIDEAYQHSLTVLTERRELLDQIAEALVERETLDAQEFQTLIEGGILPPFEKQTKSPEVAPSQEEESTQESDTAAENEKTVSEEPSDNSAS